MANPHAQIDQEKITELLLSSSSSSNLSNSEFKLVVGKLKLRSDLSINVRDARPPIIKKEQIGYSRSKNQNGYMNI